MKVEHSGFYKIRDGRLAEVVMMPKSTMTKAVGVIDGYLTQGWLENGHADGDFSHPHDLIEYLGKERPKERKTVKMAPVLYIEDGDVYAISSSLYKSEESAREPYYKKSFIRWLIDTPMAIEVEVEE